MTGPKVHYREPGTTWAWCSASIHGHATTTRTKHVTCQKCKAKGRPPRRRWWRRLLRLG